MDRLSVTTHRREEIIDLTPMARDYLVKHHCDTGILVVTSPHTTAGLTLNENADPDVRQDMTSFLSKLVPRHESFAHSEGNSDAHIKASLMGFSQTLIVEKGLLQLGQWQNLYFMEFDGPRNRNIWLQFIKKS